MTAIFRTEVMHGNDIPCRINDLVIDLLGYFEAEEDGELLKDEAQ